MQKMKSKDVSIFDVGLSKRQKDQQRRLKKLDKELTKLDQIKNDEMDGITPKMKESRDKKRSRALSLWESLRSKGQTGIIDKDKSTDEQYSPKFRGRILETGVPCPEIFEADYLLRALKLDISSLKDKCSPNTESIDKTGILPISKVDECSAKINLEKESVDANENWKYVLDAISLASFDPLAHAQGKTDTLSSPIWNHKKEYAPLKVPWEDLMKMIQKDETVSNSSNPGSNPVSSAPALAEGLLINLGNVDASRTNTTPGKDLTSVPRKAERDKKPRPSVRFSEIKDIIGPDFTSPYLMNDDLNRKRKIKKPIEVGRVPEFRKMEPKRIPESWLTPEALRNLPESDVSTSTSSLFSPQDTLEDWGFENSYYHCDPHVQSRIYDDIEPMRNSQNLINYPSRRENKNLATRVKNTMSGWFGKKSRSKKLKELMLEPPESVKLKLPDSENWSKFQRNQSIALRSHSKRPF